VDDPAGVGDDAGAGDRGVLQAATRRAADNVARSMLLY